MNEETFWNLVETAKTETGGDGEQQVALLTARLAELSAEEIIGFDSIMRELLSKSYRWDLWAAAYVAHGGCSDDSFDYFRAWLIAQGKETFEAVLANPDALSDYLTDEQLEEEDVELEEFWYVASTAYKTKTGEEMPRPERKADASVRATGPLGEQWEDEDLPRLVPKLYARTEALYAGTEEEDEDAP